MPKQQQLDQSMIDNIKNYGNEIEALKTFVEGVRKVPGMYIGHLGNGGFMNMFREIYQNAIDEIIKPKSPCDTVYVFYDETTHEVTVEDNGRGYPFHLLIDGFINSHVSSNYQKEPGEYSSGRHGVGSKVVNALSDKFIVESYILGEARHIEFNDGQPWKKGITKVKNPGKQGTKVYFHPSYEIMGTITTTPAEILRLIIEIMNQVKRGTRTIFEYKSLDGSMNKQEVVNVDGINSFLYDMTSTPLIKPVEIGNDTGHLKADITLTFDSTALNGELVQSFSNTCPAKGTHLNGFMIGLCRFFRNYMNKIYLASNKKNKLTVVDSDIKAGLRAVISVFHLYPTYSGQAKEYLDNEDMKEFVDKLVYTGLDQWAKANPTDLQKVCKLIKEVAEIRSKADEGKIKLSNNYKGSLLNNGLPAKYTKPTGRKVELWICEGDSAAGSLKSGRIKETQAVFPIRGKLPNAFSTPQAKMLKNEEISAILTIIGGGYGKSFNINAVPWEKVIISCFTGDTRVMMTNGQSISFEEMVDIETQNPGTVFSLWGFDEKNCIYREVSGINPRITKYVDTVVDVQLDNGKIITCTPEHLFLVRTGYLQYQYFPAAALSPGTSLASMKMFIDNNGRPILYDPINTKNISVAKYVSRTNPEVYLDYITTLDPEESGEIHVHHIDEDPFNNSPSNLTCYEGEFHKHCIHNSANNLYVYNKSEKHKKDIQEALARGSYEGTSSFIEYNKSEKHKEDVRRAWAEGKYESSRERILKYNQSDANKDNTKSFRTQIARVVSMMLFNYGEEFTKENYTKACYDVYGRVVMPYENIPKYYSGGYEEALEAGRNYNDKVVEVRYRKLDRPIPVYDITVPETHNFLVETDAVGVYPGRGYGNTSKYHWTGVVCHNCDADVDGAHIANLFLMFCLLYMRPLVEDGRVYRAMPPLFGMKTANAKRNTKPGHYDPNAQSESNSAKYRYFGTKLDYVKYCQQLFSKNHVIETLKGKKLSSLEIIELIFRNEDYVEYIDNIANTFAIDKFLLELVLINLGSKNFKKAIESRYRFLKVEKINGVVTINGTIDKSQTVILNDRMLNICAGFEELKNANMDMYYKVDGQVMSIYQIMSLINSSAPKDITRYKGLGEMDPAQLCDSTLNPENRTLIRYTVKDIEDEINTIRYLESNKAELLKNVGNLKRRDLE